MKDSYLLSQEGPGALILSAVMRCENSDSCPWTCLPNVGAKTQVPGKLRHIVIPHQPLRCAERVVVQSQKREIRVMTGLIGNY